MVIVAKCLPIGLSVEGERSAVAPKGGVATAYCHGLSVKLTRPVGHAQQVGVFSWVKQITAGSRKASARGSSVAKVKAMEGESVTLDARPTRADQTYLYRSDIESALLSVFDADSTTRSTPVYVEELVVDNVMEVAPVIDAGWREDGVGRTFQYVLPAGVLIEGGRTYGIELVLRTKTDGPRSTKWEVETIPLKTSRAHLGV